MSILTDLISPRVRLMQQELEIRELTEQVNILRRQNESMRVGMRRCVTCDYRLESKTRQDEKLADQA